VVATTFEVPGSVTARGGAGGDQYTANCHGGPGGAGAPGRIRIDAPNVTAAGTITPAYFSGVPQSRAYLSQPDANRVTLTNTSATALDARIVVIVP
jgi:hypothetical protein